MRIPRPSGRMTRFVVVGVTVALVGFLYDPRDLWDSDEAVVEIVLRDTATIELTTLSTDFDAEGTLAYRDGTTAYVLAPPGEEIVTSSGTGRGAVTQVTVTPASMVVTDLVEEGSVVEQGDVLWRLGNEPTVMLYGDAPSYRDLEEGIEGADVLALETALVALGYDPDGTVTIDQKFTARTEDMVARWQTDIGAEVDGVVHHGSVVVVSGPSRVGDTTLTVGAIAIDGQAAFDLRSLETHVNFAVLPSDRETLQVGDTVSVRANGTSVEATVDSTTITDDGGAIVTATPADTVEITSDEVPADIGWTIELAADVVTVPAESIVRTDDQRTWVEVRDSDGVETWVEVEVGRVSGGRIEVTGGLVIGGRVIAP
ncbi:MAG: efflux RND transporter periplasmic adaptor subunit [Actinomycetota bacterium]